MSERRSRGVFLLEALVSLAILGIVLTLGASFLARRRALEKDRLDRERAVRALASEWIYLRTSFRNDVYPKDRRPFVGPGDFVIFITKRFECSLSQRSGRRGPPSAVMTDAIVLL